MGNFALLALIIFSFALPNTKIAFAKSNISFKGAVTFGLRGEKQHCSGSIIRFYGAPKTNKALIMTNGHCTKLGGYVATFPERPDIGTARFPMPGEILVDVPVEVDVQIIDETGKDLELQPSNRLVYATFTGTDMAIYELETTYKDLEKRLGVFPLMVSKSRPQIGDSLWVVAAIKKPDAPNPPYNCELAAYVPQLQGGDWTWYNNYRMKQGQDCDRLWDARNGPGSSGSPVVNASTGEVVALHVGGNINGAICTLMGHCEILGESNGVKIAIARPKTLYPKQIHNMYTCLNENYEIDLTGKGCDLPK